MTVNSVVEVRVFVILDDKSVVDHTQKFSRDMKMAFRRMQRSFKFTKNTSNVIFFDRYVEHSYVDNQYGERACDKEKRHLRNISDTYV